jgi:hypothetical protein
MEVEMKMVKSLLLGTAAGFVAVAGAQAADMPVKAAVQYVKICNLYGDGFFYIPGTDICLKLGGYVRAQFYYDYGQNATATPFFAPNFLNTRVGGQTDFTMRSRGVITFDTRQQTEYGVLRTYFLIGHTGDSPTAEGIYANRAFIQFAGFTVGLAQSFFDFYSAPATSYFATQTEDTGDGGWRVAAFTANFGNGITSTLSLEEPRRIGVTNAAFAGQITGGFGANSASNSQGLFNNPFVVGGVVPQDTVTIRMPDLVHTWRIDQTWGAAMIGGALHDASGGYYGSAVASAAGTAPVSTCAVPGFVATDGLPGTGVAGGASLTGATQCGHPADKLGWVATGGLRLNAPGGSYLQVQGSYTEGALRYISHTQVPNGSPALFGVGNSLGLGYLQDGIFGQSGEVELTKAWGVYASWEQVWNPKWKTSLYGGYLGISYNDNAKALIAAATCGPQLGSGTALLALGNPQASMASGSITNMTNCDPNFAFGYIGSRTQWNVTSQFYMGFDILYSKLYTAFEGQALYRAPGGTPRPPGIYNIQNQDNLAFTVRFHRDFVP